MCDDSRFDRRVGPLEILEVFNVKTALKLQTDSPIFGERASWSTLFEQS